MLSDLETIPTKKLAKIFQLNNYNVSPYSEIFVLTILTWRPYVKLKVKLSPKLMISL